MKTRKLMALVGIVAIVMMAMVPGCTALRRDLIASGYNDAADVLAKYQAKTFAAALSNAAKVREAIVTDKGKFTAAQTAAGTLTSPTSQWILREYDERITSLDSDVLLISELKELAEALTVPVTVTPAGAAPLESAANAGQP